MFDLKETLIEFKKIATAQKLNLKVLKAEEAESGLNFFYIAPEKTDFRPINRELNRKFKVKINLIQLTSEEAAKLIPGFGECGGRLCWASDSCENLWGCKYKEKSEEKTVSEETKLEENASLQEETKESGETPEAIKLEEQKKSPKKMVRRLVLK